MRTTSTRSRLLAALWRSGGLFCLVALLSTPAHAGTIAPCGSRSVHEGADAVLAFDFYGAARCVGGSRAGLVCASTVDCGASGSYACTPAASTPSTVAVRIDRLGVVAAAPLYSTTLTPTNGHAELTIPASANTVTTTARGGTDEPHLVTMQWWGRCVGGGNYGEACSSDEGCPDSTCQTGGQDCLLNIRARQHGPIVLPTATPGS